MKNITFIFVACSLVLPCHVFGNDSIMADNGKTVYPISVSTVEMVKEEVTITFRTEQSGRAAFPIRMADVQCVFKFYNNTDTTINALVGFPGFERWNVSPSKTLEDFTTRTNGVELNVTPRLEITQTYPQQEVHKRRYWYTWNLSFPPQDTIEVINTYSHMLSSSSGYHPLYFRYIVETGANWAGNMQSSIVRVIYENEEELKNRVMGITTPGWKLDKNVISWEWHNFEPTNKHNIEIVEANHHTWHWGSNKDNPPKLLFEKDIR